MSRVWIIAAAGAVLAIWSVQASAAAPTRLSVTAPASTGMGEEITVEARLTTGEGQPVAGAALTLSQVGIVGQRTMARATTDEQGLASFLHAEFTLAALSLRVAFAGNAGLSPSHADLEVEITGIAVPPAVAMGHAPGPLAKMVLFAVLGSVWLTYAFAASFIVRIRRDSEKTGREPYAR